MRELTLSLTILFLYTGLSMLKTQWNEDFLYGTRLFYKFLERYRSYFSHIFSDPLIQFGYIRHNKTGEFLGISNLPEHEELYLAYEGYKDDEHQASYQNGCEGLLLTHSNAYQEATPYTLFRQAIKKIFGTEHILCQIEKKREYYNIFWWGLKSSVDQYHSSELKVYRDYLQKKTLIDLCLQQFKSEMFPIFRKKDLYRINFHDLKGNQKQLASNNKKVCEHNETEDFAKKIGFLTQEDTFLTQVKLSSQEEKCLLLYVSGYTAKEISNTISRSTRTVEDYIQFIKNKLHATTRREIFQRAQKLKLLGILGESIW